MSCNTDYIFLGDSTFAFISEDDLNAVIPHSKNFSVKGFCLKDLIKQDLKLALVRQPALNVSRGNNVVICIGANDTLTCPSLLNLDILRPMLSSTILHVQAAIPQCQISFIGLASEPCELNPVTAEIVTRTSMKRRRGCKCKACIRQEYNNTFNEYLCNILTQFNCIYLPSPASSGNWEWKDLVHLHASAHMRYLKQIVKALEHKAKLEARIARGT
jgi:hypothetical protein